MAKTTAWIFGVIFVIAGIWGFFASPVLGFLAADKLSSVIHVIVGAVLIVVAAKPSVVATLKAVGILYVLFALLGFFGWNFFAGTPATSWFYLVVGVVVAALGWSSKKASAVPPPAAPASPAPQV